MSICERCGSMAVNHHMHGRDGTDADLCDVCYWRKRAEQLKAKPVSVYTSTERLEHVLDRADEHERATHEIRDANDERRFGR